MIDINKLFFELIQVALGVRVCLSQSPTTEEWTALYDMAKKQSLVGVCFAAIQKLQLQQQCPEELLYLTWMGMAAKIQQRNEIVNRQCFEVQQMIEKAGFRTYIMKGQGNAALYHDNLKLLRQSGDIDIYLEGGFEKINAFVQRTCPTKEINELEMHMDVFPDTEVELHYHPFIMRNPFKNCKLQRFFAEEGEKCYQNKVALPNGAGDIAVPTTAFNLVHQMVHIYHHLFTEGIGLRQLLDYYFLLRSVKSVENVKDSKECIHSLGLDRFASALMWVIAHVFANENYNVNFYHWKPYEKDGRMLLEEILISGNFGKLDSRAEGIDDSKWKSFWFVNGKTFRFWRFDHWAWFWSPLWRVYHNIWKKTNGFE